MIDSEPKRFNEISLTLVGTSALSEIGELARFKLSLVQAVEKVKKEDPALGWDKSFALVDILNPALWGNPYYKLGIIDDVYPIYVNAETGKLVEY